MNEITFTILRIAITVLAALVSAYLVPYLKQLSKKEEYSNIVEAVTIAVQAAEQTIRGSGKGEEKKAEVIAYVSNWLNERGIELSAEELSQLIEASVYALKNPSVIVGE